MILLRDRLQVCGIRVKVQRRLLTEAFGKAFELAQVAELADKNVEDLQRPQTTEEQQLPRQSTEVLGKLAWVVIPEFIYVTAVEVSTKHPTAGLKEWNATVVERRDILPWHVATSHDGQQPSAEG